MINKILKMIDFKQDIFEDEDCKNKIAKKKQELIDEVDSMVNSSFIKAMYSVQKAYKDMFEDAKKSINEDLDDLIIFELDEYKEKFIKFIKQELKSMTEDIIDSLPDIEDK